MSLAGIVWRAPLPSRSAHHVQDTRAKGWREGKTLALTALLLPDWRTGTCAARLCVDPRPDDIELSWSAPALMIAKDRGPTVKPLCNALPGRAFTWDCRPRRPARPRATPVEQLWLPRASPIEAGDDE